ncbi:MAG: YbfB/YjiJ family MFS transporter [Burkholderiaceae bacterium]
MPTPFAIVAVGGLCMATAMGIGRFAFTPLLPLMQQTQGLSLANGTWLALANYLGYLVGALFGFLRPIRPGLSTRCGVALVAVSTLGMAVSAGMAAWLALRFVAGIASALVMVGVAGWALTQLATAGRGKLGGWIFGCVGTSIAAVGGVVFVVATTVGDPRAAWAALGLTSAAISAFTWRRLSREPATHAASLANAPPLDRDGWLLIVCYGVAGFGYIVPATFLPAVARALVNDPAVFGWIWPAFGIAAAISTIGVSTFLSHIAPRTVCALGMIVMAVGTVVPVLQMSIAALVVSAICVGGTFIVVTLAGLQEARRIAHASPARAVAGLTASFALGQLVGPLLAHGGASAVSAMQLPAIVATIALVTSASVLLLWRSP